MGDKVKLLRRRSYSINKVNFIRQSLAGYGGGSAIAGEMIQNADDAEADRISFHFRDDSFVVQNTSTFSEHDFESITDIAKGEKAPEEGKIGTWGTGFLSVFHISDAPELLSAGEHIIFGPTQDELPVFETGIKDYTEFRLPWRRQETELSRKLEADVWQNEDISRLKEQLTVDIYRLVLFLRHVRTIEVYEGKNDKKLIARVERRPIKEQEHTAFACEQWEIEYKRAGVQSRTDTWLYYRGHIPSDKYPMGVTIKDTEIALAFPVESRDWLAQNVPGTLYNFLPTPIQTGLPFQINGAFFPDNNRQSILLDPNTQREKSAWNRQVLAQLGYLFAHVVSDIRDRVIEPRRFYELLPVSSPKRSFLESVRQPFIQTASDLPIVKTSLGSWERPGDVFIGRRGSRLPELAADYLPVLPTGVPQEFRDFLEQQLKVRALAIEHIITHLQPHLQSGQSLAQAHPMINSREKLEILYGELPSPPRQPIPDLRSVSLCLAEDETLWPFEGEIWRADKATRRLLANTNIRFMDAELQKKFTGRVDRLVDKFQGAALVEWLSWQDWPDTPFVLKDAQGLINDAEHLAALLKFIGQDRGNIDAEILSTLPLVRSEDDYLLRPADAVYRHDDHTERDSLAKLGLAFVHPDWAKDDDIWAVYHLAGVEYLHPSQVVTILPEILARWEDVETTALLENLIALYDYFTRNIHQLGEDDKRALRRLPLCVTQKGRLVPAEGGDTTLQLSSAQNGTADSQVRAHLDKLQLDNLVHSQLIARGKHFLTRILLLEALSPARLIETVIVPHYLDPRLDDAARKDLLNYVSEQLRNMPESQQRTLFPKLLDEPLIRCADGKYRPARSVYFASPALDTVFDNGYHQLHPDYGVPAAQPNDPDQTPYRRSTWYWLFEHLGVNEHPTPADLVHAVREVVAAGPPTEARIKAVRRVYDLLNREVGRGQLEQDDELKELAQFAWLPARNDDTQWYRSRDLYQASHADFVGNQAPLMRFPESTTQLRRFLDMPAFPPVDLIANHLLASAQENKKVDRRVYNEMGRRWTELSDSLQQRLKSEAVVWGDGDKYWPACRVFLGDYHRGLFGRRRCYLKPPGGDAQEFLRQIGVKEKPDGWRDSITLLLEISNDYADDQPAAEDDLRLLYHNFDHLGGQLLVGDNNIALHQLKEHKVVPAKDGRLHRANRIVIADSRDILDQFDPDTIPVVSESELTENAYRFLRELGVSRLSQLIQRRPIDTSGSREDAGFSLQLQQLVPAFQRMALTYQEQNETTSTLGLPAERLRGVKLRVCQKLVIGYELDNRDGWRVQGHSRPEKALYYTDDKDFNFLYVKQTKAAQFPYVALARELERILFPNSKQSPIIEQLLRMKPAEVDSYLDEHDYRRLYQGKLSTDGFESEQLTLTEWEEAPETPVPDGADFEDEQDDSAYADDTGGDSAQPNVGKDTLIDDESASMSQGELDLDSPDRVDGQEGLLESDGVLGGISGESTMPIQATSPGTKADDEPIPPFTGIRRPPVPVLPNDYGELQRKFGLERTANEVGDSDTVEIDHDWRDPTEPEPKDGVRQVRQTRFTLTFTNRYQGFLPLHRGARQMLHDQPAQLHCQTDFEEWAFPLYINYNEGIIYNQKMLPKFFEAYNIPAGGIVYLERVSHDTVRLFWKPMNSLVKNIRCLELLEDGTLDEYEVPVAEFPCEIAEYVLRAEKRLEDPEALFKQALSKRGVFQTICEVFGEPDRELSYDEIYQGVMARRMVAKASIDYQLNQRPCFVNVGSDRWRFEPEYGSEPSRPTQRPKSDELLEPSEKPQPEVVTSAKKSEALTPQSYATPYHRLFEDIKQEWYTLGDLFQLDGDEPRQQLERLSQGLITLGQRLQADLAALAQSHLQPDDLLTMLWQQLLQAPQNGEAQRNLQRYLAEQIQQTENFMKQIEHQLASTPYKQRNIVFPILSRLAGQMAEQGHITVARQLYNVLQEQGAGNFERELAQLAQIDDVNEYIQLVEAAETEDERWEMWREAWQKHPGFPTLRQAIQKDIRDSVDNARQAIEANLTQGKSQDAFENYLKLLKQINPFVDAWQTNQNIPSLIEGMAQRLFETFQGNEDYQQALQIVASLPPKTGWNLSGDIYLEAIQGVAGEFENRADNLTAAALIDYGIYLVEKNHWPVDNYVLSSAYENIGRLYQNLAMTHRAYNFISKAQRKATGDRKTKLGHRAYDLNQRRDKTKEQAEAQSWKVRVKELLQSPDFRPLIDPETFRSFCGQG